MIDVILDVAKQKGTGMWTTESAMELQIPTPTIDVAVSMRDLSMQEELRYKGNKVLHRPLKPFQGDRDAFLIKELEMCEAFLSTIATQAHISKTAQRSYL